MTQEFPRSNEELREHLESVQPGTSGNVKDIYIGEEEVMKVSYNPTLLDHAGGSSTQTPEYRINLLESIGISIPETEILCFDLEGIERTGKHEQSFDSYSKRNPVVFQNKCDVLSNPSYDELEDVLNTTDKARGRGICFPDNSPENWGYQDNKLVRIDVCDDVSVSEMWNKSKSHSPRATTEFASNWAPAMNEPEDQVEEYVRANATYFE